MVLSSDAAARPRLRRALVGAACVWLPPLAALALSPLHECGHCLRAFAVYYALAPGVLAGLCTAATGSGSEGVLLVAAPATLGMWWAASAAAGAGSRRARLLLLGAVAVLSGTSAVVFGHLLRM